MAVQAQVRVTGLPDKPVRSQTAHQLPVAEPSIAELTYILIRETETLSVKVEVRVVDWPGIIVEGLTVTGLVSEGEHKGASESAQAAKPTV